MLLEAEPLEAGALPAEALPAEALPAEALPAEALPAEALPGALLANVPRSVVSFAFPGSSRVKKRARFLEIQQRGRKIHTAHFVVSVLRRPTANASAETRLGITVTKRVANAVGRNRVKRMVREVFRCNRTWFPLSSDVVVIAKEGAPSLRLADVHQQLGEATQRLQRGRS